MLVVLLVIIGGARFLVAIATGLPLGAEPTLGLLMFIAGAWWGMRSFRLRRSKTGKSPDETPVDRARDTMWP